MARKKVVFVTAKGPSDETALAFQFDSFFEKEKVHIRCFLLCEKMLSY